MGFRQMSKKIAQKKDDIIARIRADLESTPVTARMESAREIVIGSVDSIHARIRSGERIQDIHPIINARLEAENRPKITLQTFGKYWREARNSAGLPRIKDSGPKSGGKAQLKSKTANPSPAGNTKLKHSSMQIKNDTTSDFRTDPDDI
jgi:hypothetical protein